MSRMNLDGYQRRYLRSVGHHLKPLVQVGKGGLSPAVLAAVDEALDSHELIKVRLVGDKAEKKMMIPILEDRLDCAEVGMVGHVVTLYREQSEPSARRVKLPVREG